MKILIFGGVGRSLLNFRGPLIRNLTSQGHSVITCAGDNDTATHEQLALLGLSHTSLGIDRRGINPMRDAPGLFRFMRLLAQERPDVLLAYTLKPVLYGMPLGAAACVPRRVALITGLGGVAGDRSGSILGICTRAGLRLALRSASSVVFQNKEDQQRVGAGLREVYLANGSGIDLAKFLPLPEPRTLTFTLVARLIPQKGIREFARAAEVLRRKYGEAIRFQLVGAFERNGITSGEVQQWVDAGWLHYLGTVTDIRTVLQDTSVLVLPSYYPEGVPRSLLEGMACARPLITTDTPGCRTTVRIGHNGFLVEPRHPAELVNAMERFIADRSLIGSMGAASRLLAEELFDVKNVNRIMLAAMGL